METESERDSRLLREEADAVERGRDSSQPHPRKKKKRLEANLRALYHSGTGLKT